MKLISPCKTLIPAVLAWLCSFLPAKGQVFYQPDFLSIGTPFGVQEGLNLTVIGMKDMTMDYMGRGVNGFHHNLSINLEGQYPAIFSNTDYEKIYFMTPNYQYQNVYCHYIYACSDSCLKSDIRPLPPTLGKINKLRFVKESSESMKKSASAAARICSRDMLNEFPEITEVDEDDQSVAVNYMSLIPILLQSVKELQQLVDEQDAVISELSNLIHD